ELKYIFKMLKAVLSDNYTLTVEKNLDWNYIYKLCKFHHIDNIIGYISNKPEDMPEDIYKKFQLAKQKGMVREINQHFELQMIQEKFAKCKIDNIALKGSFLKKYYPSPDMRFLTDLDILFKDEKTELVKQTLLELDYQIYAPGEHHDVYIKEPYMTVEMHRQCYNYNDSLDTLLDNIWQRCIKVKDIEYAYEMPIDDFYIYMVGHMAKHFKFGGVGIRMILDFMIFEDKLEKDCDRNYIELNLDKAGLLQFEKEIKEILNKCLDDNYQLENDDLINYIISSGAYGTAQNNLNNEILKDGSKVNKIIKNRIKMLLEIIFPCLENMKNKYSYVNRFPFLLPIAWIHRGVTKIIVDRNAFIKIIKSPFNKYRISETGEALKKVGLDKDEIL
ncbi:nucleotidyltransferase family protein, partial [Thomasclavelia cocleata]